MKSSSTNASSNAAQPVPPGARTLVLQCREAARTQLGRSLADTIASVENDLYERADRARSSADQQLLLDAMVHVRRHRSDLLSGFDHAYPAVFDERVAGTNPAAAAGEFAFTLVEHAALEANLIVRKLAQTSRYGLEENSLRAIELRIASLCGIDVDDRSRNPLDAEVVFEALNRAVSALPGGAGEHHALLSALEPYVTRALDALYVDLNARLAGHGIMPSLRWQVRSAAPAASAGRVVEAATAFDAPIFGDAVASGAPVLRRGTSLAAIAAAAGDRDRLAAALTSMLDAPAEERHAVAQLLAQPEALGFTAALATPATPAIVAALSDHQALVASPDEIRNLLDGLRTRHRNDGHPLDLITVELVSLVFEGLLGDEDVARTVRAEIARLQIVAVKAALLDRTFFASRTHPVRRLLDRLADIATEPDLDAAEGSAFLGGLRELVSELVTKFERDLTIFSAAMRTLDALAAHARATRVAAVAERAESLAKIEHAEFARVASAAEVRRRIAAETPAFVQRFLLERWTQIVAHAHVNGALDDDAWARRLEVVDALVWSVNIASASDVKRLAGLLPKLMRGLIEGMQSVDTPKEEREHFFTALMQCHTERIHVAKSQGLDAPSAVVIAEPRAAGGRTPGAAALAATASIAPLGYDRLDDAQQRALMALSEGTVIALDAEGVCKRWKLTWISPSRRTFLFVTAGEPARSFGAEELAELMREKRAWMVAPRAEGIVETTLSRMLRFVESTRMSRAA